MSAAEALPQRHYTVEEYFALEDQSEIRHEYYHGEIFPMDGPEAMAGATLAHNTIKQNCVMTLRHGLRGSGCRVFDENVRLNIAADDQYTYPDILATCHPADRTETRLVRHPSLIIEVLSSGTAARDRGWKFQQYQLLPSLQQYVLVSQIRVLVESFIRTDHGTWELTTLRQLSDVLAVPSLKLEVPIVSIYEEVELGPLRLAESDS